MEQEKNKKEVTEEDFLHFKTRLEGGLING